jgi:hypothetical protein
MDPHKNMFLSIFLISPRDNRLFFARRTSPWALTAVASRMSPVSTPLSVVGMMPCLIGCFSSVAVTSTLHGSGSTVAAVVAALVAAVVAAMVAAMVAAVVAAMVAAMVAAVVAALVAAVVAALVAKLSTYITSLHHSSVSALT